MSTWTERPISELCSQIIDCVNKTAPVVDEVTPYKMIRTTNVRDGRIDLKDVRYVKRETYERWTRRGVPVDGDIVLTREAPLGEVGLLRDARGVFLGQRLVMYRADPEEVDPHFLFYAMRGPDVQAQIKALGSGATVEHMRVPDCSSLVVTCPPISVQRRIGYLLAAFDELISIADRTIEHFEGFARSLYREWFVRPRSQGHRALGLAPYIADTDGAEWETRFASEIFVINPKVRASESRILPKVTMADVDERISAVFPSTVATRASGSKFQQDDVLLARITPCLENGKTALVKFLQPGEVAVGSTEFIVLRGATVGPAYTYCAARSDGVRGHAIKSMSGSSGRQRVTTDCFDSLELPEPPRVVADRFEQIVGPMLDDVFELARLNRALAATRDLLLPRLVTGRLDISDVDLGDLLPTETAT